MHVKNVFAVATLALCAALPLTTRADKAADDQKCNDIQVAAKNACIKAANDAWDAYFSVWNATTENNNVILTNARYSAEEQEGLDRAAADRDLYLANGNPAVQGDIGSCGRKREAEKVAAEADKLKAQATCEANQTCEFRKAKAEVDETKCNQDATAKHDVNDIPAAEASREQKNSTASLTCTYENDKAWAAFQKADTQATWDRALCEFKATCDRTICLQNSACANDTTPQSIVTCCKRDATIKYQEKLKELYTTYITKVGPATAQYQNDYYTCGANKTKDDQTSTTKWVFDTKTAINAFNYQQKLDLNTRDQTKAISALQRTLDEGICGCNYSQADPKFRPCMDLAADTEKATNDKADAAYRLAAAVPPCSPYPPGANYMTCISKTNTAYTTCQSELRQHTSTANTCYTTTLNTLNGIRNPAELKWNTDRAAAEAQFKLDLEKCNPSA